jgi:hypothetical protein
MVERRRADWRKFEPACQTINLGFTNYSEHALHFMGRVRIIFTNIHLNWCFGQIPDVATFPNLASIEGGAEVALP